MTLRPASSTLLVVASPTVTNVVAGGPHSLVEVRQQAGGLKIEKQGDLSKREGPPVGTDSQHINTGLNRTTEDSRYGISDGPFERNGQSHRSRTSW